MEIKNYNVMIDGRNLFDKPIKNDLKTLERLQMVQLMITQQGIY